MGAVTWNHQRLVFHPFHPTYGGEQIAGELALAR